MTEAPAGSPVFNVATFQSVKKVMAGEIAEVVPAGCYVKMLDGSQTLMIFQDGMTARYVPVPGDFWVQYEDGYQSISPRSAFLAGYVPVAGA